MTNIALGGATFVFDKTPVFTCNMIDKERASTVPAAIMMIDGSFASFSNSPLQTAFVLSFPLIALYVLVMNKRLQQNFGRYATGETLHTRIALHRNIAISRALLPTCLLRAAFMLLTYSYFFTYFYLYPAGYMDTEESAFEAVREIV